MTDRSRVTGHYAGPVTRLGAFAVDAFIVTGAYSLAVAGFSFVTRLVGGGNVTLHGWVWAAFLVLTAFFYSWASLAIAGRTPGKVLVGLRVVTRQGQPIQGRQAFVRTVSLPLSFLVLGLGLLGIVFGREHRALHDLIAGTSVVYDWGDRPAELPSPLSRFLERRGALVEVGKPYPPGSPGVPGTVSEPAAPTATPTVPPG